MIVNISEAKTNLSKLKVLGKRKLGLMKGKLVIPANFNEEDEDINEMFYGS